MLQYRCNVDESLISSENRRQVKSVKGLKHTEDTVISQLTIIWTEITL